METIAFALTRITLLPLYAFLTFGPFLLAAWCGAKASTITMPKTWMSTALGWVVGLSMLVGGVLLSINISDELPAGVKWHIDEMQTSGEEEY